MTSIIEIQPDLFGDNSPIGILDLKICKVHTSSEKVRRGVYAKVGELKKENLELKKEIEEIKKFIGMKNEKCTIEPIPVSHYEMCLC
jgi:uncharacterized protein YdcH (DUF465 family)